MIDSSTQGKIFTKTKRNDLIKVIAMLTMLIDHMGVLIYPEMRILRTIGRIAFPIFAYQIAIGYTFTSNKWRYAKRLLLFGLISQIPYLYLNTAFEPEYFHLNVILLFLLGIGVLALYDLGVASFKKAKEEPINYLLGSLYFFAMVIAIFAPEYFSIRFESFAFSYSYYGLIMILIFYVFRGQWLKIFTLYFLLTFGYTYAMGAEILSKYSMNWLGEQVSFWNAFFNYSEIVWENITTWKDGLMKLEGYFFQARSIMGVIIIFLLEKRPTDLKLNKYVGYLFYPVHISVLVAIRYFLGAPIQ